MGRRLKKGLRDLRKGKVTKFVPLEKICDDDETQTIMEEVERDPEVAKQAEENQRKYGTLTTDELNQEFTI